MDLSVFLDSNLQLQELCGHIALSETSRCRNVSANCPQYAWVASDWLSCVPQTSGISTNDSGNIDELTAILVKYRNRYVILIKFIQNVVFMFEIN